MTTEAGAVRPALIAGALCGVSGGIDPLKLFDLFDDVNGTLLPAHAPNQDPVGNGWQTNAPFFPGGDAEIQNNTTIIDTSGSPGNQRGNSIDLDPVEYNDIFEIDISPENLNLVDGQQIGVAIFKSAVGAGQFDGFILLMQIQGGQTFISVASPNIMATTEMNSVAVSQGLHAVKLSYAGGGKFGLKIDGGAVQGFATVLGVTAFDCVHVFGTDDSNDGINLKSICSKPSITVVIP